MGLHHTLGYPKRLGCSCLAATENWVPERETGNEKRWMVERRMKPRQRFLIKAQSLIFSSEFIQGKPTDPSFVSAGLNCKAS